MTSCSEKNNDDDPITPIPQPTPVPESTIEEGTAVNPASMTMSALSGFVYNQEGEPLQNVTVTSGSEVVLTGPDGGFVLDRVNSVNGRTVVTFSSNYGYYDVVRSMITKDGDVWEVTMPQSSGSNYGYSSKRVNQDVKVTAGGMSVDLQANGFKYAESGEPVTGMYDYVNANVLYLSPDDKDFATMMPGGDLAAVDKNDDEVQLVSYGMSNVSLTVNGLKVQPADGKPATVTFPVPDKFKDVEELPAEIPLWSFNEQTGLWEEEGVATYDSENNVYVGTVTHFSWVNLDYPEKRGTLKVNIKDEAGNVIPNQIVDIDGQRSYTTDVNGKIECYIPINTDFYVTVRSSDYSNYSPEVKVPVEKITTAGGTRIVNITLPTMVHISGKVVNSGRGNNLSSLWIEYGEDKATKAVHTDADGQFILNAPFDYTGTATLVLLASDGSIKRFDINLDGQDHAYTLSIKTDKSTGGIVKFTPIDGPVETSVIAPMFTSDLVGVELIDKDLLVSTGNIDLTISNYSENKSVYNDVSIRLYTSRGELRKVGTVTVTKNEFNNYTFKLSGSAYTAVTSSWVEGKPIYTYNLAGTLDGEFSAPMLGKGKVIKPVTKKENYFPSFTPWLTDSIATIGLQITESSVYGTGVLIWYFNEKMGYKDYKKLMEQAQQVLGEPFMASGREAGPDEYQDMCYSYFYKEGKFIMVSYCPWREEMDPETMSFNCLRENHAARIQVHALEGLTASPDDFVFGHGIK